MNAIPQSAQQVVSLLQSRSLHIAAARKKIYEQIIKSFKHICIFTLPLLLIRFLQYLFYISGISVG